MLNFKNKKICSVHKVILKRHPILKTILIKIFSNNSDNINYRLLFNTPILSQVFLYEISHVKIDLDNGIFIWHSVTQLDALKRIDNSYLWPTKLYSDKMRLYVGLNSRSSGNCFAELYILLFTIN